MDVNTLDGAVGFEHWHIFSKVRSIVILHSQSTSKLTFQNSSLVPPLRVANILKRHILRHLT